jgi:flagellar protein FliL
MAAKSESVPAAEVSPINAAGSAPRSGGAGAWIPVLAALILTPAATWGTVEYVLVPRLQKKLTASSHGAAPAATPASHGAAPSGGGHGGGGGHGKETGGASFEFQNVVVNLAGTMGTRYLKVSFVVSGAPDSNLKGVFDGAKPRLTDVSLNVLSSLTLAELEEPGAKNVIREKLVGAYNQALGRKVAEQVYFSDFVIQ